MARFNISSDNDGYVRYYDVEAGTETELFRVTNTDDDSGRVIDEKTVNMLIMALVKSFASNADVISALANMGLEITLPA
jgi:hypothetical protein